MQETTFEEYHYRAAVNALDGGDWQEAATHLLALVSASPHYRRVRGALKALERAQPGAYWRAAFEYALQRRGWDHAATALEMLFLLSPGAADLPALRARLEAQTPPAPNGIGEGASGAAAAQPAEPAAPTPYSVADILRLTELSEEDLRSIYAAADAPDMPAAPPPPATLPEIDDRPLVLKSPLFATDTHHKREHRVSGGVSAGPVYNALGEPLALKSAFLLEDVKQDVRQNVPDLPTRPADFTTPLSHDPEFATSPFEPGEQALLPPVAELPDSDDFDELQPIPLLQSNAFPLPLADLAAAQPQPWVVEAEAQDDAAADEALGRLRRYERRSGWLIVLAAVLLLAVLTLAIVVGMQERSPDRPPPPLTPVSTPTVQNTGTML